MTKVCEISAEDLKDLLYCEFDNICHYHGINPDSFPDIDLSFDMVIEYLEDRARKKDVLTLYRG